MSVTKDQTEKIKVRMISLALQMVDESVPVLVLFQHNGKIKTYGSKNILDVVQDILKNDECEINNAVEKDAANLADIDNCDDPLIGRDFNLSPTDRGKTLFKHGGLTSVMEPLPYPLSIMTFPETIRTLRDHIVHDKIERTGLGGKIKFGNPDWEPSFWLNHLWKWTDMKCNFKNLTLHHFPSSSIMGLLEFYKLCIKQSLELLGLDPETFYTSERTREELEYRQKSRACRSKKSSFTQEKQINVYCTEEINPDDMDHSEEEKFVANLEQDTEDENNTNLSNAIDEDVKDVELEEDMVIAFDDDVETFPRKRKSEALDNLYQPPIRRNSVICYKP